MAWERGAHVVRREVWRGRPWMGTTVVVVDDAPDVLATYLPPGAPFAFPAGEWPGGRHPWEGRGSWEGNGVLMLQRPGDSYAVWVFWDGPERRFAGWYLNLQEPFRRTSVGFDTQDLELDVWVPARGAWRFKDEHLLAERVREGRFTSEQEATIRRVGAELGRELDRGRRWWDEGWAAWRPDPGWGAAGLPAGWEDVPAAITTERLVLCPPGAGDLDAYAAVYGADAEAELSLARAHWERHGFGPRLALQDGQLVAVVEVGYAAPGVVGFEEGEVEIGWVVAEHRRGRGLATEASRAVAADVLARPELDHLVAYVRPANAASLRVCEKLGMRRRGAGRSRSGDPVAIFELRR